MAEVCDFDLDFVSDLEVEVCGLDSKVSFQTCQRFPFSVLEPKMTLWNEQSEVIEKEIGFLTWEVVAFVVTLNWVCFSAAF